MKVRITGALNDGLAEAPGVEVDVASEEALLEAIADEAEALSAPGGSLTIERLS